MVPNRKKNLSSKIIVDEYDHLILNSKIYPNYESFMEGPINLQYSRAYSKNLPSKDQSQQSEYSIHKTTQKQTYRQCKQCGQLFLARIYESHARICEKKYYELQCRQDALGFNQKNQHNFFELSESPNNIQKKLISRGKISNKKSYNNVLYKSTKQEELKRQLSKKSIHSQQKKTLKRPLSSARNKYDLKEHENLKQKILNKLQATRKKNPEQKKQEITKHISQSSRRNITSNSNPKSMNKNSMKIETNKFSTIKSSSINKKIANNKDFNRSEIINNYANLENKKQKPQFLSKVNFKEEKKQTLKKKNINFNNSFVNNQLRQKEHKKNHMEDKFFTENNSFARKQPDLVSKKHMQKDKELIRDQLRKQGVFRRQSSSSASERKFNQQRQKQKPPKQCPTVSQQVNDQYYFFQNHPSIPSYVIKRPEQQFVRHDNFDNNSYGSSSSNIIRNKLGINNNFIHSNESTNHHVKKDQLPPKCIRQVRQEPEIDFFHKRNSSNIQHLINQRKGETKQYQKRHNGTQQGHRRCPTRQQLLIQRSRKIEPKNKPQTQQINQNQVRQSNGQRPQTRRRPENPMGQQRQVNQRRQNMNMGQNRPSPRITSQRMNQNEQEQQTHTRAQNRLPIRREGNQPRRQQNTQHQNKGSKRQNNPIRRQQNTQNQNRNPRRQGNQSRGQQNVQNINRRARRQGTQAIRQGTQARRQGTQARRQGTQARRQNQSRNRRSTQNRNQPSRNGQPRIMRNQTLNFISHTLNQQFDVMNQHFNLLNNIFSNFSNFVNVNVTASSSNQNPPTFAFHRRGHQSSGQSHSSYTDFSSDFSQDDTEDDQTDYDEGEYYFEGEEEENPGMTEQEIGSIPVLRYNRQRHGVNQCTICLVELNQAECFKKLYCEHVFHQECIDQWLKRKKACPVCRDQMGVSH